MPVAATGTTPKHIEGLIKIISECAAFQSWVGAGDATAAKDSIKVEDFESVDFNGARPFCMIAIGSAETNTIAANRMFSPSAMYQISFERDIPVEYRADAKDAGFDFMNGVEAVKAELESKSDGTDGGGQPYIRIATISRQTGPLRRNKKTGDSNQDFFVMEYDVTLGWG